MITPDKKGDIWVGGAFFTLQGFLLRVGGEQIKPIILPEIKTTVHDLTFTTPKNGWMLADYLYLYTTTDGGDNWHKAQLDQKQVLTDIFFSDSKHGWIVGWNGTIYHTNDGGSSWVKQESGTALDLKKVMFVDSSHGWIIGGKTVGPTWRSVLLATDDGGKTWKTLTTDSQLSLRDFVFVDARQGWGLDFHNNILRTTNGGATWSVQRQSDGTTIVSIFFFNEQEGLAIGNSILRTEDGGNTWSYQNDINFDPEHVVFTDSMHGWAVQLKAGESPNLIRTNDGGLTWNMLSSG